MPGCAHVLDGPDRFVERVRDPVTGDSFELRRCAVCNLVLTWPMPAPEEMTRFYPDAYYGDRGEKRFVGPIELLQRTLCGRRAKWVEEAAGGIPGRVLDVGCGRGFLLDAFRRRGWDVRGTELSPVASAHAREVLGVPVQLGPLEALGLPDASFDAVTLWHVLEHVRDPASLLCEAHRILRPDGVLLVSVPDFGSVEARLAGAGWFHLDVPRHLIHFTSTTLDAALAGAGFEMVAKSKTEPEYDAFSLVQSALNRSGLRQNALYDALRGRAAKFGSGPMAHGVASMALAIPLTAFAVPFTLVAGWAGFGATLTVLVRRRTTG